MLERFGLLVEIGAPDGLGHPEFAGGDRGDILIRLLCRYGLLRNLGLRLPLPILCACRLRFLLRHNLRNVYCLPLGLRTKGYGHTLVVLLPIGEEGVEQAARILLLCPAGVHVLFLVAGRDKSQFDQTARHGGETEHGEVVLLGTHILAPCGLTHIALHVFGQLDAVLHVLVLDILKHDVALGRIGIVAVIGLLIVFLKEDNRVLALGHFEVLHHARLLTRALAGAEGIGLEAARHPTPWQGIDMDGDKQVGLVLVGNLRTAIEFDEAIRLAGVDHLHARAVFLYHAPEGQGELQRQVLLLGDGADGTRIMSAVSGIDYQRKGFACSVDSHCEAYQRYQQ